MKAPWSNLVAWQRADDLFIEVHQLTLQLFPSHEKYEVGSLPSNRRQSRRSHPRAQRGIPPRAIASGPTARWLQARSCTHPTREATA
jgi:hypothetical protein